MDASEVADRAWALRVNMMRVALSILRHTADAEDAVATAMLNAYHHAGEVRDAQKLPAWLMRILVRCCYDLLRRRGREVPVETMEDWDRPALADTDGTVYEAIRALPQPYQRVLVLFYYEGFKAREIARILSMPTGTVLVQLSRGRARLRAILEAEGVVRHDEQRV